MKGCQDPTFNINFMFGSSTQTNKKKLEAIIKSIMEKNNFFALNISFRLEQ